MFGYRTGRSWCTGWTRTPSGVLLLARTDRIARALSEAFATG